MSSETLPCPCCGYKTAGNPACGIFEICAICFWEDDPTQLTNPDQEGGANKVSLRTAQQNFLVFGASEKDQLKNVRKPLSNEKRDTNWKPL